MDRMEVALLLSWVRALQIVFHAGSSVSIPKGDRLGAEKCAARESVVVMGSLEPLQWRAGQLCDELTGQSDFRWRSQCLSSSIDELDTGLGNL